MFGFGNKQKTLDLSWPAVEQPQLGESPSQRIMKVGSKRSVAYGLLFAAMLSIVFNVLFAFLMITRIEVIPYVADGSSYGCSPQVVADATAQTIAVTPQPTGLSELTPIITDVDGEN